MKTAIIVILILILIFLFVQIYFIFSERNQLKKRLADLSSRFESLSREGEKIKSEIDYFSKWDNLEKELRSRFNYKKIGENLMIIVQ